MDSECMLVPMYVHLRTVGHLCVDVFIYYVYRYVYSYMFSDAPFCLFIFIYIRMYKFYVHAYMQLLMPVVHVPGSQNKSLELVGWLVRWLAGWLAGWLDRWLVGGLVGLNVEPLVG